jgi:hypothetical protein
VRTEKEFAPNFGAGVNTLGPHLGDDGDTGFWPVIRKKYERAQRLDIGWGTWVRTKIDGVRVLKCNFSYVSC